jgi:hypothetical protein
LEPSPAQGGVGGRTPGKLDFPIAGRADDADVRRLLRENATGGWIGLALEREPDAFAAAAIMGRYHRYILARDEQAGEAIGLCEWSARESFIDGEVRLLSYLGALRIAASHRHRLRILRQGFEAVRSLPGPRGATPYALTAIAAENHKALRLLGRNLPGMPSYRLLEAFSTFALRPAHARHPDNVERADANDLAAIAVCLERTYRQFQFAPVWRARDLADPQRCPGLRPEDFLIVRRGPGIAACVALWNQSAFKQTTVRGYPGWLRWLRPALNAAAPLLHRPRLPAVGEPLRQIYLSHLAVEGNDEALFRSIVAAALSEASRRGFAVALLGLASRHPLAGVLTRSWRPREYRALLHLVHWADGAAAVERLAPRIPHVEIAVL